MKKLFLLILGISLISSGFTYNKVDYNKALYGEKNLSNAKLGEADLRGADLRNVKGWRSIKINKETKYDEKTKADKDFMAKLRKEVINKSS